MSICHICNSEYKRSFYKHLLRSSNLNCNKEANRQKQLVISAYTSGELYDLSTINRLGIICNSKEITQIIHKTFPDKQERKHYSSLIRSNAKRKRDKEIGFIKTDKYITAIKNIPIKWDAYISFKNNLNWTFDSFNKQEIDYSIFSQQDTCNICNEKFSSNGKFYHFHMKSLHDAEHKSQFDYHIKNIIKLFFDLDFSLQEHAPTSFFNSIKVIRNIWNNVFTKEETRDRGIFMLSKGHIKDSSKNFKHACSTYQIDWNKANKIIDTNKLMTDNRNEFCPICNKHLELGLWNHLRLSNDKLHQDAFYSQIKLAIDNFKYMHFNRFRDLSKQNFLFDYNTAKQIWKKYYGEDLSNKRCALEEEFAMAYNKDYFFQNRRFKTIRGFRKDLGFSTKSSWEANIFRILIDNNCKFNREIPKPVTINNKVCNYFIDLQDIDGFFGIKNAFIEVKGFLSDIARSKIEAFRNQYPTETLLVIGDSASYKCDLDYYDLISKFKVDSIYWETLEHNPRTNPELYLNSYKDIANAEFDMLTKSIIW